MQHRRNSSSALAIRPALMDARTVARARESTGDNAGPARAHHTFAIGFGCAVATTVIAALQPVITRYSALRIDPLLFCAGAVTMAALVVAMMLAVGGELATLFHRDYRVRLFALS